jgi:hypothetical protein
MADQRPILWEDAAAAGDSRGPTLSEHAYSIRPVTKKCARGGAGRGKWIFEKKALDGLRRFE